MTLEIRTFCAPAFAQDYWLEKWSAVKRIASKLELEQPQLHKIRKYEIKDHPIEKKWVSFTVSIPTLKIADWTLAAVVEPLAEINGQTVNDVQCCGIVPVDLEKQLRTSSMLVCDHCNRAQQRQKQIVVRNGDAYKILGTTCAKDFLGHSVSALYFNFAAVVFDCDEDFFSTRRDVATHWPTEYIVARAIRVIAAHGGRYTSKQASYDTGSTATADEVQFAMADVEQKHERYQTWLSYQPVPEDLDRAQGILAAWGDLAFDGDDSFEFKLYALAKGEICTEKLIGTCVGGVGGWWKRKLFEEKREAEEAVKGLLKQEHFGSIGERSVMTLSVTKTINYETDFGSGLLLIGHDDQMRPFKTFTSGDMVACGLLLNDGTPAGACQVAATIKEHADDSYGVATLLSRIGAPSKAMIKKLAKRTINQAVCA